MAGTCSLFFCWFVCPVKIKNLKHLIEAKWYSHQKPEKKERKFLVKFIIKITDCLGFIKQIKKVMEKREIIQKNDPESLIFEVYGN